MKYYAVCTFLVTYKIQLCSVFTQSALSTFVVCVIVSRVIISVYFQVANMYLQLLPFTKICQEEESYTEAEKVKRPFYWRGVTFNVYWFALTTRVVVIPCKKERFLSSKLFQFKAYFTNYCTNTRHVCTDLNAFLMVNPNKVTRFRMVDIYDFFGEILDMSSAQTCR